MKDKTGVAINTLGAQKLHSSLKQHIYYSHRKKKNLWFTFVTNKKGNIQWSELAAQWVL